MVSHGNFFVNNRFTLFKVVYPLDQAVVFFDFFLQLFNAVVG